jgi:hypothetical protein
MFMSRDINRATYCLPNVRNIRKRSSLLASQHVAAMVANSLPGDAGSRQFKIVANVNRWMYYPSKDKMVNLPMHEY